MRSLQADKQKKTVWVMRFLSITRQAAHASTTGGKLSEKRDFCHIC